MEAVIKNKRIRSINYTTINDSEESKDYKEYRRMWVENPIKNIVNPFPIHLDIEINSNCNLQCVMCFQSFDPPKKGYMTWNLYKKLIDEGAEKGLKSIKLMYRGEPLLHPEIVKFVKYAKDKGIIEVMFNTNANLLTEKMSRDLIDAGLDRLICSVDGYEKAFYEKIRVGGKFKLVVNNIKRMQEIKSWLGVKKPIVRVQMLKLKSIKNVCRHVEKYKEFWGKIADDIGIDEQNEYDFEKIKDVMICKDFKCTSPWQRLFVMWNGEIRFCCGDIYGKMILGNAKKDTIEKIWNGKRVNDIRILHISGYSHMLPICNTCGGRRSIIENNKLKHEVKPWCSQGKKLMN